MKPLILDVFDVRALLAGLKTQHRLLVDPRPRQIMYKGEPTGDWQWPYPGSSTTSRVSCHATGPEGWIPEHSPFGQVGDRLWIREQWCPLHPDHWESHDHPRDWLHGKYGVPRRNGAANRADCGDDSDAERCRHELGYRWRSAASMPRWASRLTLEVTDVRLERMRNISETDARAQGMRPTDLQRTYDTWGRDLFHALINFRHGLKEWDRNPWMWSLAFKRVDA